MFRAYDSDDEGVRPPSPAATTVVESDLDTRVGDEAAEAVLDEIRMETEALISRKRVKREERVTMLVQQLRRQYPDDAQVQLLATRLENTKIQTIRLDSRNELKQLSDRQCNQLMTYGYMLGVAKDRLGPFGEEYVARGVQVVTEVAARAIWGNDGPGSSRSVKAMIPFLSEHGIQSSVDLPGDSAGFAMLALHYSHEMQQMLFDEVMGMQRAMRADLGHHNYDVETMSIAEVQVAYRSHELSFPANDAPEAAPEIAPEVAPEAALEVAPEVVPEAAPQLESAMQVVDLAGFPVAEAERSPNSVVMPLAMLAEVGGAVNRRASAASIVPNVAVPNTGDAHRSQRAHDASEVRGRREKLLAAIRCEGRAFDAVDFAMLPDGSDGSPNMQKKAITALRAARGHVAAHDHAALLEGITITCLEEQAIQSAGIADPAQFKQSLGKDYWRICLIVHCRGWGAPFPTRFEDTKNHVWYTLWDEDALARRRRLCSEHLDAGKLGMLQATGEARIGDRTGLLRELIAAGFTTDPNLGLPLLDPYGQLFEEGWQKMGLLVTRLNKAHDAYEALRLREILTELGEKLEQRYDRRQHGHHWMSPPQPSPPVVIQRPEPLSGKKRPLEWEEAIVIE